MENLTQPPKQIEDDNPTDEQLERAFKLAQNKLPAAAWDSEEFNAEFGKQLNTILTEEALQGLIDKGFLERAALEDGTIGYNLTPDGEVMAELLTED